MRLHFLVEGTSEQQLLEALLPRLIPSHSFQIYPHQGKGRLPRDFDGKPESHHRALLEQLPAKLRGWRSMSPASDRVVVLVDADDDDCAALLARLGELRDHLGVTPYFITRLAIEEVEAWYLGDPAAMKRAFRKVSRARLSRYQQDSICGTWETLREVIGARVTDKVGWAARIGAELAVDEPLEAANASPSFRKFCRRIRELAGDVAPARDSKRQRKQRGTG